jgi:hypothetical protein
MSIHINKFIDRVKANESRGQRDFIMTMAEAKDLHSDITKLLLHIQALAAQQSSGVSQQILEVEVKGGTF